MKLSRLKNSFVVAAFAAAPFLAPMMAHANTTPQQPLVNQEAVRLLTTSVQDVVDAYETLTRGDTTLAKRKIDSALGKLNSAVRKDQTLGLTYGNMGAPLPANRFETQLRGVKSKLTQGNTDLARQELERVLSSAGIV